MEIIAVSSLSLSASNRSVQIFGLSKKIKKCGVPISSLDSPVLVSLFLERL